MLNLRDLDSYRLSKLIIALLVFTLILGIPKNVGAQFTLEPKINLNGSLITMDDYPMYIDATGRMMVSSSLVNKIVDEAGIKQENIGGTSNNTFIPLRSILEKHNFEINWDNESKIAYIDTANANRNINNWEINLWQKTVTPYLKEDLWNCRESADAMEVLMIPLHAAFQYDQIDWQNEFAAQFQRFMKEDKYNIINESADNDFVREQYLYLASQFVTLAIKENRADIIPHGLINELYEETVVLWKEKPAWMWNRDDFKGGMKERIVWKLNNTNSTPSYYHAFIDSELFLFAIAADLKS